MLFFFFFLNTLALFAKLTWTTHRTAETLTRNVIYKQGCRQATKPQTSGQVWGGIPSPLKPARSYDNDISDL